MRQHLAPWKDTGHRPVCGATNVHVLNESHFGVMSTREFDQIHQLVLVDAADDDGIQLDAGKERGRDGDSIKDAVELVESRERSEPLGLQSIETDRQAMETCVAERDRLRGEQYAVRGQGQVANRGPCRKSPNQVRQIAPQERLPAREPNLVDAERGEDVDQMLDLLEL